MNLPSQITISVPSEIKVNSVVFECKAAELLSYLTPEGLKAFFNNHRFAYKIEDSVLIVFDIDDTNGLKLKV